MYVQSYMASIPYVFISQVCISLLLCVLFTLDKPFFTHFYSTWFRAFMKFCYIIEGVFFIFSWAKQIRFFVHCSVRTKSWSYRKKWVENGLKFCAWLAIFTIQILKILWNWHKLDLITSIWRVFKNSKTDFTKEIRYPLCTKTPEEGGV